ncbi:MAG: FGGY-family carbohydrate kinase [Bdellovibrionales bacterium]|nr:FGGY-family carbohydrate kinase [Bdellovibrionales bacterium]
MVSKDVILTIDLGTSGPKVSFFDRDLNLIASAFREVTLVFQGENGIEQRPSDWICSIQSALDEIYVSNPSIFSRVRAVNVTAQWSGTVAVSDSGEVLCNAILWMDARGAPDAARLTGGFPKIDGYGLFSILEWIRITGGGPTKSGKDSISHILYLKRSHPEIYHRTKVFLEPKDYLNFFLTGLARASFESITVHWLTDNRNIEDIHYSDRLIRKSGINREKLPELAATNSILGTVLPEIARKFRIPENTVVIAGTPDLHSAAVGSGAVGDFDPHLYIGTSSWLITHVPYKKTDLFHNMASIPSAVPGRYFLVNEQQTAGASLQFLKNRILFPEGALSGSSAPSDIYERMDQLAASVPPGADGLMFFPWLNGERSPFDARHLRGGFVNLSLRHEQKHLVRAVMEGVALNLRWLKHYAEKFCGRSFKRIRFIGGGAKSEVWAEILADVLRAEIEQMEDPLSANSRGVAALAWVALGERTLEDIGKLIHVRRVFSPREENSRIHDQAFESFVDYFARNESWFKRVNSGRSL